MRTNPIQDKISQHEDFACIWLGHNTTANGSVSRLYLTSNCSLFRFSVMPQDCGSFTHCPFLSTYFDDAHSFYMYMELDMR